jgi:hypothetical protein
MNPQTTSNSVLRLVEGPRNDVWAELVAELRQQVERLKPRPKLPPLDADDPE